MPTRPTTTTTKTVVWPSLLGFSIVTGLGFLALPYVLPAPHNGSAASFPPMSGLHGWCPPQPLASNVETGRVLLVATSHSTLGWTRLPTGLYMEELTEAYYQFSDAGWKIDIASPQGGKIPVEPASAWWLLRSHSDARALKDPMFLSKFGNSTPICDLAKSANEFNAVYIAGGAGAGFDLRDAPCLAELISDIYSGGGAVGATCHGPLALIRATDKKSGQPLLKGRPCTGVTNKQMSLIMGMHYLIPHAPEDELKKTGCDFIANTESWTDLLVTEVVRSGRIVTGQNQKAACHVAREILSIARYNLEKGALKEKYASERANVERVAG